MKYPSLHKKSSFSVYCALAACILMGAVAGCQTPQYEDQDKGQTEQDKGQTEQVSKIPLPNAESYEFDITVLSEWAGNILPKAASVQLIQEGTKCYFTPSTVLECNWVDESTDSDTGKRIELNVNLKTDDSNPDNTIEMSCLHKKCNENQAACNAVIEKYTNNTIKDTLKNNNNLDLELLDCNWTVGGAADIYGIWENMLNVENEQIRLGVGDNFGLSADISSQFEDMPPIDLLSNMGFSVDTVGNHSFDKHLGYMKNVISRANYPFVATNLKNVQQNDLINTYKYAILNVKSSNENVDNTKNTELPNDLPIAFVSALGQDVSSSVFSGRFGTLEIGDYCSVAQSIEEAYNDGARAFFVLGHLSMDDPQESLRKVLNAIFSFADNTRLNHPQHCRNHIKTIHHGPKDDYDCLADSECKRDDGKELTEEEIQHKKDFAEFWKNNSDEKEPKVAVDCPSKIVVPFERIKTVFGEDFFKENQIENEDDFANYMYSEAKDDMKEKYNGIVREIRKEIYNSIIGIVIEGEDEKHVVTPLILSSFHTQNSNVCMDTDDVKKENHALEYQCFDCYYDSKNGQKKTLKSLLREYNIYTGEDKAPLFMTSNVNLEKYQDTAEHPIWLFQVPMAGKQIGKLHISAELTNKDYNVYHTRVTDISFESVLNHDTDKNANLINQASKDWCDEKMQQLSKEKDKSNVCSGLYEKYKGSENTDKDIDDLTASGCAEMLKELDISSSDDIYNIQHYWKCLYSARFYNQCLENDQNMFKENVIFAFEQSLPLSSEDQDRSEDTARTNLVVDIILDYVNSLQESNSQKYTAALINSGTARETGEIKNITPSLISELLPFDNTVKAVKLSVSDFVEFIEAGLAQANGGGFPSISGIHYSTITDNGKQVVQEIWSVDNQGRLIKPIYLVNSQITGGILASEYTTDNEGLHVKFYNRYKCSSLMNSDDSNDLGKTHPHEIKCPDLHTFTSLNPNLDEINILTLDFILNGGDKYGELFFMSPTFEVDLEVEDVKNLPPTKASIASILKSYFKYDGNSKVTGFNKACSELIENAESNTTVNNRTSRDLYCSLLVRRHFTDSNDDFYINTADSDHGCDSQNSAAPQGE